MNILQNAGKHEILHITENPLQLIERCGRIAYQSQNKITKDSAEKFVRRLIEQGHESVLEHSTITIQFDNVSIGFSRELNRHRLISVTEKSTRYVTEKEFNFVFPPTTNPNEFSEYEETVKDIKAVYTWLRSLKVPAEDARQILPLGIATQLVVTANFREWRHILKLRTRKESHWEMRYVMRNLLKDLQKKIPVIFDDIYVEG